MKTIPCHEISSGKWEQNLWPSDQRHYKLHIELWDAGKKKGPTVIKVEMMYSNVTLSISIDHSGVQCNSSLVNTHRILTEEQNKTDNFIQNRLHLLMTAFTNSRECHKTSMSVPPIRCAINKTSIKV